MSRCRSISYSADELAWVQENCTLVIGELHRQFLAVFERNDVSAANLNALRKRNGWRTGRTGHFSKGHDGYKGGPKGPNSTSFKKGGLPANLLPLYSERTCKKDGYILIKVPEKNPYTGAPTRFIHKHLWLWQCEHGPVPSRHVVIFKDGDKTNCELDNLVCVHRGVLPIMNKYLRVQDHTKDFRPTLIAVAQLQHKTASLAKAKR